MNRTLSIGVPIAILLALIVAGNQLFDTNSAGYIKIRQMPVTGNLLVVRDPGMFGQWFGQVWEYKQAGTYSFGDEGAKGTIQSGPIEVRFNDAGRARVAGNVRFDLPTNDEGILNLHFKFRSYEHMAESLLKPAIAEALILTASLMSAEESYSGRRSEYSQLAWDQVLNGVYLTEWEEAETVDPITSDKTLKRIVKIRRDQNGNPMRKPNPLQEYQITASQFFIDRDLEYEEGVLAQIKNQRDARMKTITAKAEAEKAQQDLITAEARGKADVMQARYEREVEKEKAVVAATESLRVAELDRQTAEQEKQANILRGQGEAERKRLVIQADGALTQKLDALVAIQQHWASAYAQRRVPSTVFAGASGDATGGLDQSAQSFMQLLTLKAAQDLQLDTTIRKGGETAAAE